MRIGIVSDTHNDLRNLHRVVDLAALEPEVLRF